MKTLKEYADFLYARGYKESPGAYLFLCGALENVTFEKNEFSVVLTVHNTEEFDEYLESLTEGEEYEVDYNNYYVCAAFIESPIANVSNFLDGSRMGIELNEESNDYNSDTLELFEYCLGLQSTNVLEHELFIMQKRMEHLEWAHENLVPVLEKCDYYINFDSFFETNEERDNSNVVIIFKHPNRDEIYFSTHCLTGKMSVYISDGEDIADDLYGKTKEEIYEILLEKIWKKDEEKFGYIYNNDPHETVDTYHELTKLWHCIRFGNKRSPRCEIDFSKIPVRYNNDVEYFKNIFENEV